MKAIIFDMDGVLVNTEPLHYECWKAALADEGVDMSYEVYKPCIGSTVGYLMKLLKAAYGENISDAETASDTDVCEERRDRAEGWISTDSRCERSYKTSS